VSAGLTLRDVTVEGRGGPILDGVTLDAAPGERLGVAGPNGAGKSTLARLIVGAATPTAGELRIDGLLPTHFRARFGIGFLHEDGSRAWERITPRDVLTLQAPSADPIEDHPLISALRLLPLLDRRVATLSKGEWRACQAALALWTRPRLALLDEPESGLDPAAHEQMRSAILWAAESGTTCVVFSHHLDLLVRTVDRLVILSRGRVCDVFPVAAMGVADVRARYLDATSRPC
jgi:ABC-type multidrug transport system ATPase subunit